MAKKMTLLVVACFLPILAIAQGAVSYECSFEQLKRRIEIFTEPGVTVPCEVHYYKDNEVPGRKQVLWRASSEEGYCEARTEEFVDKLRSWGWSCAAGTRATEPDLPQSDLVEETEPVDSSEVEPAADDTAALEPAD